MTFQPKPKLDRFFSGSAPLIAEFATAKMLFDLTGSDEFRHRLRAAVDAFLDHEEKMIAKAKGALPE